MILSILIPARNEEFLQRTVDDILENSTGDTEVIVGLDGWMPENKWWKPKDASRVKFHIENKSIGQRAMTNKLAELSSAKYVMKTDAHVSFSKGFDTIMIEDMEDNVTLVLGTCNLHAYDWVCENGHRHFQGKYDKCEQCGSTKLNKDIIWKVIAKPIRSSFYFDTKLHFQYMPTDPQELLHETMSIQGSSFMITRDKYWELNICDEDFGSWGQQGVEVACKTWLSGGRVLSTRKAYYGHQFRETEGFPYPNPAEGIFAAQKFSRDLFLQNKWPKQVRSIQWLIKKFNYPGDWSETKVAELCKNML